MSKKFSILCFRSFLFSLTEAVVLKGAMKGTPFELIAAPEKNRAIAHQGKDALRYSRFYNG